MNKKDVLKFNEKLDGRAFKFLTQAEYDSLSDIEKNDDTIIYNIIDSNISALSQEEKAQLTVSYSHAQEPHAPNNAKANVQSDWEETDETSDAYIKNKPTSIVLTSPSGKRFQISVTDDGVITATEITS